MSMKNSLLRNHFERLADGLPNCKDESELADILLEEIAACLLELGIDLSKSIHREENSGIARIDGIPDALVSFLVLDFKTFNLLSSKGQYNDAIDCVLERYLKEFPARKWKQCVGILFDGKTYAKVTYDESTDTWESERHAFNLQTFKDLIGLFRASRKKQASEKALIEDFSIYTDLSKLLVSSIYSSLGRGIKSNESVRIMYNDWKIVFDHIYGGVLEDDRIREDFQSVAGHIMGKEIIPSMFLFSIYTYYALLVKLIAAETLVNTTNIPQISVLRQLTKSRNILKNLECLESGEYFRNTLGIENYIEDNHFSWYLQVWDTEIENAVRELLNVLGEYDPGSFELEIKRSRDFLKVLYEEIVPDQIRHDLGEYYTPDWLIQLALERSGYEGNIHERLLDPGCGSGGFLIEAINTIREVSPRSLPSDELLTGILENVVGFDVNPVAVLTARTNYVIAVSDLLSSRSEDEVLLPVYMCDSVITPTTDDPSESENNLYKISLSDGTFSIHRSLVHNGILRLITEAIEEMGEAEISDFFHEYQDEAWFAEYSEEIIAFLEQLESVPRTARKTWIRLVVNSFAPLFVGKFDYVVGNPPWIKWDFLSEEYKAKLKTLYLQIYDLFSHEGMNAGLGFAHDDISIVFTYVTADKYLKLGGTLAFILKQTLYKSAASKEFRKFKIERNGETTPLKVIEVVDLVDLHPFKPSRSETSLMLLEKGESTTYPVSYDVWLPKNGFTIDPGDSLKTAKAKVNEEHKLAMPDPDQNDPLAPWVVYSIAEQIMRLGTAESHYRARHGIVNDLNAVFFLEPSETEEPGIISVKNNIAGRKKVASFEGKIESDLVYPTLKPRHVKKWRTDGYSYALMPQRSAGEDNKSWLKRNFPKTYRYLLTYKDDLESRSSKWFKGPRTPFYSIFGIGEYTFSPYRVVWCCMSFQPSFSVVSTVDDNVLGKKALLPDNVIGFVPADSYKEAHFICGVLNSLPVREYFESRSNKSKWGISIGMVNSVPIPRFSETNDLHGEISRLSQELHDSFGTEDDSTIERLERELDTRVCDLFEASAKMGES